MDRKSEPLLDASGKKVAMAATTAGGADMDEDKFNMSLRKFLKQVGVTSQREIERVVREKGASQGKLKVKSCSPRPAPASTT
jgi:hypothetical protein